MSTYRDRAAAAPYFVMLLHGMLAFPAVKRMQRMRARVTHGNVRGGWSLQAVDTEYE